MQWEHGMQWEYSGNTVGMQWECSRNAVGMQWRCSGDTVAHSTVLARALRTHAGPSMHIIMFIGISVKKWPVCAPLRNE